MEGKDPVKVIREALRQTLVYYYPFAGRLREGPDRELIVDCNCEGIMFIEADADVRLDQFGDALYPPIPCLEELLYEVPGSGDILNCPLLLIQVTRMECGGFILAVRLNHVMTDAVGLFQFLIAVGEMARGLSTPSILPVWQRELLRARNPPRMTSIHNEFDDVADTKLTLIPSDEMVHHSFFFSPTDISALYHRLVPPHLVGKCSTFDVITSCLWRCRTIALQLDPSEKVQLCCIVNARMRFNPPLPSGYYGNVIAFPIALTTAGNLCENPIGYALELVWETKKKVNEEYMKSMVDLKVLRGRPKFRLTWSYVFSDLTRTPINDVNFGWGKAASGGPAIGGVPGLSSFYMAFKNGIMVPMCLPADAMVRFVHELDITLHGKQKIGNTALSFIKASI